MVDEACQLNKDVHDTKIELCWRAGGSTLMNRNRVSLMILTLIEGRTHLLNYQTCIFLTLDN
jgi:hypothetical protein